VKMWKTWLRFTVIGAFVLALAACGNQTGVRDGTTPNQYQGYRTNTMDNGTPGKANGLHNNQNMRVDRKIARMIEQINGISRANVLVGDTNAYVAVELDANQKQARNDNDRMNRTDRNIGQNNRGNMNPTGMMGTMSARDGVVDSEMNGISSKMRQQIEQKVRQQAPKVKSVFISSERDFVDQMTMYGKQFDAGRPVRNLMRQFNNFVGGIFITPFQTDNNETFDRDNRRMMDNMNR